MLKTRGLFELVKLANDNYFHNFCNKLSLIKFFSRTLAHNGVEVNVRQQTFAMRKYETTKNFFEIQAYWNMIIQSKLKKCITLPAIISLLYWIVFSSHGGHSQAWFHWKAQSGAHSNKPNVIDFFCWSNKNFFHYQVNHQDNHIEILSVFWKIVSNIDVGDCGDNLDFFITRP